MIVPNGVDYSEFYKHAKTQGVSVSSRYIGVTFSLNGNKPFWLVRFQKDGKAVYLGRYPFTKNGEIKAHKAYENYIKNNGLETRYTEKRKYKNYDTHRPSTTKN